MCYHIEYSPDTQVFHLFENNLSTKHTRYLCSTKSQSLMSELIHYFQSKYL